MKRAPLIELYAIAAYTIFQKNFNYAGLLDNGELRKGKWPLVLRDRLKADSEIANILRGDEWLEYHNYLRDRYNAILKTIQDGNPKRLMGFNAERFLPLLIFSKTENAAAFNEQFKPEPTTTNENQPDNRLEKGIPAEPVSVPALYSPTTFGRFDILRNPDNGFINFYPNGDFVFEGNISLYVKNSASQKAVIHSMFGDEELWIKVLFEKDRTICTAYFAEIRSEGGFLKLCNPAKLLNLFNNP